MSEDELFEKLQSDLQAEIKATAEKAKAVPISLRFKPGSTLQEVAAQMGTAAFRRIKNGRWYALDNEAKLEIAALVLAAQKAGIRNIVPVLEAIADVIPNWRQQRPPEDAGTVPKLPVDPCTGERIRNPFEPLPRARRAKPGDPDSFDYASQNVLRQTSPSLAAWLEQAAKNHGVTAKMLDELEGQKIEADAIREIQYGDREWEANKLRPNSGANLTEQNLFARSVENPYLLQLHRQEAAMGSPRLSDTLTTRMALFKRSQESRAILKDAHEILRNWKAEEQQKAAA